MSITAVEHHDVPAQPAPPSPEVGELAWVDPRELVVRTNVRGDAALDRHFVRDIADRGVREPIPVRRRDDGALVVRKGHRRTLAAIEAGLQWVRVFIEPGPPADEDAVDDQIDRIIDQLGENQHRAGLADADEVRAHQQLLDLGLSAGQIARRTHTPTQRVKATTAVARSELAAAVLDRYDLTLDQVAVIAEFDDGTDEGVEAVKLLTVTAQRDAAQFTHHAQRLRHDRADQELHAARVEELREAGVAVIDAETAHAAVALTGLRPTPGDPDGAELTETAHAGCPGHAAQVQVRRGWGCDEPTVVTTYLCTDPAGNGHAARWGGPRPGGASGGRGPGPMSDEEKAERRRVVENNKAWDSAAVVRAEWLTAFLGRKTAPRGAARYITLTLARGSHDVRRSMENAHPTACRLLGLPEPSGSYSGKPNPIAVAAETAGSGRLTMLTLAVLLGGAEDALGRHSWRSPTTDTRAYFTALDSWGYPLAPVERLVIDPDADRETSGDRPGVSDRERDIDDGQAAGEADGSPDAAVDHPGDKDSCEEAGEDQR